MQDQPTAGDALDSGVHQVFAMVSQALAKATDALLHTDHAGALAVIESDRLVDEMTARLEGMAWSRIDTQPVDPSSLRYLVGVLLILPELERSADLAEHIAQLALGNLGTEMTPVSRGIVQRMTEVALEMWQAAADAYSERTSRGAHIHETDVELDILHERLSSQIAAEDMAPAVAGQVALLARFYERLGDHAVNLARRVDHFPPGA
jgi:phosphate transport system protein